MLAALGVVYGDIGTSPLYAMQTVFSIDNGAVQPTPLDVYGVVSLIFWSITLVVSIKYVLFVLRADNDGEGGVMALAALARRVLTGTPGRRAALVMALGVLGAALFYGDSVITPAISVLSAIEGLEVVSPGLADLVVPIAAAILAMLFAVQRWGTHRVGSLFGPVMLLWFAAVGVAGLREVFGRPSILQGLSPSYAVAFAADRPCAAFIAMGAVVLAITGAEALYADMGHFGRSPIRRAWFLIVFPALTLNYLAQGALILRDPATRANPFYLLLPSWAQLPMIVLATVATVIASQAVISGAFSVSRQALRLGFLPHLRIRHTSSRQEGQIYVPAVNRGLFVAVLAVTLTFRASTRLATAYGVAVTGTFLITTALLLAVARAYWRWPVWRVLVVGVVFGVVELTYFAANLTKVTHGGWLTLLIAAAVFTVMMTWQRGREIVTARRHELEGPLSWLLDKVRDAGVLRVPGTAVLPHPTKDTTPLALRANLQFNHVLHERVVIISGRTETVPHIPRDQRLTVDDLSDPDDGIVHITARFGFQDRADFPEVLRQAAARHLGELTGELDPDKASYFVSRISLRRTDRPGMSAWRKALFISMAHNAASQAEFLCLPYDRTVVMGSHVDL
ncbi:potassium transporter Kup [Pseudonocardia sp. K10HN5]|uniref:Probable potassium transport system protein Kup n=2 Tax=Pseudonocardia acidicola TaxID=2724939 RepID=A0ABX1SA26_9PSEU|nr:potassium transporter Kup [Pseudonocardia acidicola]NMH98421.1 potassium transporter Kup [Pseudonocardia acidicola]